MAKKVGKKNRERKAKRRLAKAQLEFHIAQEKLVQARARGKQEVEQARLRAARWSTRAAQQVERAAESVSRAEERLFGIQSKSKGGSESVVEPRAAMIVLPEEHGAAGSA
jgi:hypothetical protein